MKRTMYAQCAETWLWEVTLDRDAEIDHRSPRLNVVAESVKAASDEALAIVRQEWKDEGRWYQVLAVRALHPINGMASGGAHEEGT